MKGNAVPEKIKKHVVLRDEKGRIMKGCSGNPQGAALHKNTAKLLMKALEAEGKSQGETFHRLVAKRCWSSNKVLCEVLKKIVPDKIEVEGELGATNYVVAIKIDGKKVELPTTRKTIGGFPIDRTV